MYNYTSLIRAGLMLLAVFFRSGIIPTGVDGGGEKAADAVMVIALGLAAGDRSAPPK